MSLFMTFVLLSLCCSASYLLGAGMRNAVFESQPWRILRWDPAILGYRVVPDGYDFLPNDRVMMAVEINAETSEVVGGHNE